MLQQEQILALKTKRARPPIISISDIALVKIKELIALREKKTEAIRIEISGKGCSGLSYKIEFTSDIELSDDIVEKDGVKIIVDSKSALFLIGSVMDYEIGMFKSGFVFNNPNAKGTCGCGESFHV